MKTRREVLQGLIVSIGGVSMLTACGGDAEIAVSTAQSTRFYDEQELALLSRISDLLLPRTETPGALDVNVPGFLDGLMADWANTETQASHRQILAELAQRLGADFTTSNADIAEQRLIELDNLAFTERTGYGGYRSLKGLITQSYFASEAGALEEQRWVASPGRWDPCVEIT